MNTFLRENQKYITWAAFLIVAILGLALLYPRIQEQNPSRLIQSTISGILVGGVYALVALGIVIINKSSGVFNFAHGWMMLVGGLIFYSFFTVANISIPVSVLLATATVGMIFWQGFSLRNPRHVIGAIVAIILLTIGMTIGGINFQWLHAIVGAVTGAVLLGLVIERFTIRPLIGQPLFASVLMTLAIAEVLHGFTQAVWGSVELTLPLVQSLRQSFDLPSVIRIDLGGTVIVRMELLLAFVLSIAAFVAFILFFRYTNIGLAMRATSEDQQLAQSTGIRVRSILATAWAVASLLAMVAGVLQGGAVGLSLNNPLIALRAFPAVLLGGLESVGGALVGGLVIGLVEQWSGLLFSDQVNTELAPYVILMIVLILRPEGLFGQKIIERI